MPNAAERLEEFLSGLSHDETIEIYVKLLEGFAAALTADSGRLLSVVEPEVNEMQTAHRVPPELLGRFADKLMQQVSEAIWRSIPGFRFDEVNPTGRELRRIFGDRL